MAEKKNERDNQQPATKLELKNVESSVFHEFNNHVEMISGRIQDIETRQQAAMDLLALMRSDLNDLKRNVSEAVPKAMDVPIESLKTDVLTQVAAKSDGALQTEFDSLRNVVTINASTLLEVKNALNTNVKVHDDNFSKLAKGIQALEGKETGRHALAFGHYKSIQGHVNSRLIDQDTIIASQKGMIDELRMSWMKQADQIERLEKQLASMADAQSSSSSSSSSRHGTSRAQRVLYKSECVSLYPNAKEKSNAILEADTDTDWNHMCHVCKTDDTIYDDLMDRDTPEMCHGCRFYYHDKCLSCMSMSTAKMCPECRRAIQLYASADLDLQYGSSASSSSSSSSTVPVITYSADSPEYDPVTGKTAVDDKRGKSVDKATIRRRKGISVSSSSSSCSSESKKAPKRHFDDDDSDDDDTWDRHQRPRFVSTSATSASQAPTASVFR